MKQLQLPIVEVGVAQRIEALLVRCDRLKLAKYTRPAQFNAAGERHAAAIAQTDLMAQRDEQRCKRQGLVSQPQDNAGSQVTKNPMRSPQPITCTHDLPRHHASPDTNIPFDT